MAIATLSIDIEARLARLEEGLDKAARINAKAASDVERRWQEAGNTIRTALAPLAAALSVQALTQFVQSTAQAVDALNDVADATGAGVEKISALQDVARKTGTDVAVVETALIKLNQALNAAKPDSDAARALKAIGLNAAELKQQDPAEALRQVAVALGGFADDGNKARLVQELFGKSLREVAPLLKDLATQTELVGSVTKEQADEAERFTHALGEYQAAATKARQALVGGLLPTLTEIIKGFTGSADSARSFADAADVIRVPIEALAVLGANVAFVFKGIGREVGAIAAQMAALGRGDFAGISAIREAVIEDGQKARAELERFEAAVLRVKKAVGADAPESLKDTRGGVPSVGDVTGGGAARVKRGIEADLNFRRSEIASTEKVNNDLRLAQYDKFLKERQERIDAEVQQNKQVFEFIDRQREEDDERQRQAAETPKKKIEELSEFAKQAQRNIQDALGDSLLNVMRGNFASIEQLWKDLLQRMVAQALAAKLNESLFGKPGKDGAAGTDGLLSGLLRFFGSSFAVGSESVPRDMLALVHQGERIVPAHQNRADSARWSATPVVINDQRTINVDVASRTEVMAAIAASDARRNAEIARQSRRGEGVFR